MWQTEHCKNLYSGIIKCSVHNENQNINDNQLLTVTKNKIDHLHGESLISSFSWNDEWYGLCLRCHKIVHF